MKDAELLATVGSEKEATRITRLIEAKALEEPVKRKPGRPPGSGVKKAATSKRKRKKSPSGAKKTSRKKAPGGRKVGRPSSGPPTPVAPADNPEPQIDPAKIREIVTQD